MSLSSLSVSAHEADDELLHHSENDDAHSVLITTNNRQCDLLLCTHSCRVLLICAFLRAIILESLKSMPPISGS